MCGLVPLTRDLLEHPGVVAGSTARVEGWEAAIDAAAAAAGDVDLGALNLEGPRRLSMDAKAKREAASRRYHGMEFPDDDLVLADLGEDGAALVRGMDGVKTKGLRHFPLIGGLESRAHSPCLVCAYSFLRRHHG